MVDAGLVHSQRMDICLTEGTLSTGVKTVVAWAWWCPQVGVSVSFWGLYQRTVCGGMALEEQVLSLCKKTHALLVPGGRVTSVCE